MEIYTRRHYGAIWKYIQAIWKYIQYGNTYKQYGNIYKKTLNENLKFNHVKKYTIDIL